MSEQSENRKRKSGGYQGVGVPRYPDFQYVMKLNDNMEEAPQDNRGPRRRIWDTRVSCTPKTIVAGDRDSVMSHGRDPPSSPRRQRYECFAAEELQLDHGTRFTKDQMLDSDYDTSGNIAGHNHTQPELSPTVIRWPAPPDRSPKTSSKPETIVSIHNLVDEPEFSLHSYDDRGTSLISNAEFTLAKDFWPAMKRIHLHLIETGARFWDVECYSQLQLPREISESNLTRGITEVINIWHEASSESSSLMLAFTFLARAVLQYVISTRLTSNKIEELLVKLERCRAVIDGCNVYEGGIWQGFAALQGGNAEETQTMRARAMAHLEDKDLIDKMQQIIDDSLERRSSTSVTSDDSMLSFEREMQHLPLRRDLAQQEFYNEIMRPQPCSTMTDGALCSHKGSISENRDLISSPTFPFLNLRTFETSAEASQRPQRPQAIRYLAQRYQLQKRPWSENLSVLLDKVKTTDSAQSMLHWLQHGYRYIRTLRKLAPSLESSWTECQKGLDLYSHELEKCRLHEEVSTPGVTSSEKNVDRTLSALYFGAYQDSPNIDFYMDEATLEAFDFDIFSTTPDLNEQASDVLPVIASEADQPITDWRIDSSLEPVQFLTGHDPLQRASRHLANLSALDLRNLHDLILEGWDLLGQDMRFDIYMMVEGILSDCIFELAPS